MILTEEELQEYLEGERISSSENIKYPPILDYNPIKAADFLTIENSEEAFKLMLKVYKNLNTSEQQYIILEKLINLNFDWFASFTLELCNLLEKEPIQIPYERAQYTEPQEPIFFPPLKYYKGKVKPKYFNVPSRDPVDHHRIRYIGEAYELTDFRDGFPVWYMFSNTTIYERYSAKTNVRARIDYRDGVLNYYLAGASDNWKNIVGVPLEMDDIISSLIFRD